MASADLMMMVLTYCTITDTCTVRCYWREHIVSVMVAFIFFGRKTKVEKSHVTCLAFTIYTINCCLICSVNY